MFQLLPVEFQNQGGNVVIISVPFQFQELVVALKYHSVAFGLYVVLFHQNPVVGYSVVFQ